MVAGLGGIPASAHILADSETPGNCPLPPGPYVIQPSVLPTKALITDLLNWIGGNTDYDVASSLAHPPTVSFCNTGETLVYEGDHVAVPSDLRGAYDWPATRVLLARPWAAESLRDQSVLLHELGHHVQLQNRRYSCLQEPEWQAYKLQEAWLAEQGIASGFDWLVIYMASRCPRDHHP